MDELERIRNAVDAVGLPGYVREVKYYLDEDWAGDPAVYIYLILADDVAADERNDDEVARLDWEVTQAVLGCRTERVPYVRVRTVSEERELAEH